MDRPEERLTPAAAAGRRLLLAVSLLLAGAGDSRGAGAVFVASVGNDSNNGRAPDAPMQTVAAALRRAGRGSTVYLRRGDRFHEAVNISGVNLGSYGLAKAPLPAICGSVVVRGWKRHEGDVWVARAPGDGDVVHLFVDGKLMRIARFPNTGWLRAKQGSTPQALVDGDLSRHPRNAPDYWKGAQVRWRRWSWWFETRPVTGCDGAGRLSLGGERKVGDHTGVGSGYYLDNKLEELDSPGEWYWDAGERKVYLRAPGDADPNDLLVEGACLEGSSARDCTIENVAFEQFTDTALSIGGAVTIRGCRFAHNRHCAVTARGVRGVTVAGNEFVDNLNVAISWFFTEGDEPRVVEDNVIRRTGVVGGYGGSGAWHAAAIIVYGGEGLRIRHNVIDECGYAGVILGHEKNHVEYNVIRRAMSTLNDGGGVYTNCHRSYIRGNVIIDTVGNLETSHKWYPLGHGIWLEFLGDFRESVVEGNTVVGSGGFGLFLPKNYECVVKDNVFYGNEKGQIELENSRDPNHRIEGNVLYSPVREQPTLVFKPDTNWGQFKGNVVCNAHDDSHVSHDGRRMTVRAWQERFAWADREARALPAHKMRSCVVVNNTKETREVPFGGGAWQDLEGKVHKGSIELGPYESRVLVGGSGGPELVLARSIDEDAPPAADGPKPKAKREPKELAPKRPARRVPRPGAVEKVDGRLQGLIRSALDAGRGPRVFISSFRRNMELVGMDDAHTLRFSGGGLEMKIEWPRLSLEERAAIAAKVVRAGSPTDHLVAAFYRLAAGDAEGARRHVGQCPGGEAKLDELFTTEEASGADAAD